MKTALILIVLSLPALASAQEVWRCGKDGRSYSSTPCAAGRRLDALDARPLSDIVAAQAQAAREIQLAERLRRERLAEEAATQRGSGLIAIGPRTPEFRPVVVLAAPRHRQPRRTVAAPSAADTSPAIVVVSRSRRG